MRITTPLFVALLASSALPGSSKTDLSFGYTPPTPACGTVFHITKGQTIEFDIQLADTDPSHSIGWVSINQPSGSIFSPGSPLVFFSNGVDTPTLSTHFSWTPAADQTGSFDVTWDSANFPDGTRLQCGVRIVVSTGPFNTFTQGGWGAKPAGNNPGTLLKANFATVYPNGVEIGIAGAAGKSAKFSSASAIEKFLPSGGTPGVFTGDFTNPTGATGGGSFAGQVLALQLNVDFSAAGLPAGSAGPLGDLKFKNTGNAALDGQTVSQVLAACNKAIGGGGTSYGLTISGMNDLATNVNEGFDEGHTTGWATSHLGN